ncbi:MAG: hypothetical protein ACYC35_20760 [Pirellulales bacterium]
MDNARIEAIRQVVVSTLSELGMPEADWSLVNETILLRDRHLAGRRFEWQGVRVVWLAEQGIVKFYGETGELLKSVVLDQSRSDRGQAA